MSTGLAAGLFLVVVGLVALSFGIYTLIRGGRGQQGGFGPLSERGINVVLGIRMTVIGLGSVGFGAYLLWTTY